MDALQSLNRVPLRAPSLVAATLALGACVEEGSRSRPAGAPPAEPAEATCTVSEVGRHLVSPETGLDLYVEPHVVGHSGDTILMAGQPTYSWTIDRSGRGSQASAGDFFGALVAADGEAGRIPMPPGVGPLGWTRGAPLGDGRWVFIFDELDGPSVARNEVVRVLHGVYGPDGWDEVEAVPVPPRSRILTYASSMPVPSDDGFQWAVPASSDGGGDALLYTRSGTGWDIRPVGTSPVVGADLLAGPDGTPWLVAAGLDPALGETLASVRLFRGPPSGAQPLRLDQGAPGVGFRSPSLMGSHEMVQAAWLRRAPDGRSSAWVVSVPVSSADSTGIQVRLLDDNAQLLRRVGTVDGAGLWATLAADAISETFRIRLHRVSDTTVQRIADIESPFEGPFNATISPEGELLLIGPDARTDTLSPFVRSLVIRLFFSCEQVAAADHVPGP